LCNKKGAADKKTLDNNYVKQFLKKIKLELLEPYIISKLPLKIKCLRCNYNSFDNNWFPSFNNLQQGHGCPNCSGKPRMNYSQVKQFLKQKRKIKLLSKEYINNREPLGVECMICGCNSFEFQWKPSFHSIKDNNSGCPNCAKNLKLTYKQVKQFLLEKKIELLSNKYINSSTKLKTKCLICNCIWFPTFDNIKQGKGCPNCNKAGKSQKQLFEILKSIFSDKKIYINYKKFDWLKNPETRM